MAVGSRYDFDVIGFTVVIFRSRSLVSLCVQYFSRIQYMQAISVLYYFRQYIYRYKPRLVLFIRRPYRMNHRLTF